MYARCEEDKPLYMSTENYAGLFLTFVSVLISADSASTLMGPLWIQHRSATCPAIGSNISGLLDKFSLAQSKHMWLKCGSRGGKGCSHLLSLAVRTSLASRFQTGAKCSRAKAAVNNSHFYAGIYIHPRE